MICFGSHHRSPQFSELVGTPGTSRSRERVAVALLLLHDVPVDPVDPGQLAGRRVVPHGVLRDGDERRRLLGPGGRFWPELLYRQLDDVQPCRGVWPCWLASSWSSRSLMMSIWSIGGSHQEGIQTPSPWLSRASRLRIGSGASRQGINLNNSNLNL